MWNKAKDKLSKLLTNVIAYTLVISIGALILIVPITLIGGCIKLIIMMFGV
jgi:hypothetical protein